MVYIQNKLRTGSLQSMTSATLTLVGQSWIWISVNHSAAPPVLLSGDRNKNFNPIEYFKSLLFLMWRNTKIAMDQDREKQPGNIFFWTEEDAHREEEDAVIDCNILRASEQQEAEHCSHRSRTLELVKKTFLQLWAQHRYVLERREKL